MTEIIATVLLVSVLLVVISFLLPLSDRLKLPSNVLLAVLGMILGLLSLLWPSDSKSGLVGDLLSGLHSIDVSADIFLYVFLPVLLFFGALTIEVQRLFDEIGSVLVLAIIGVLICTVFVGYSLYWLFDVTLFSALLLGAVVAATDPSAVVAIFRDLGAPRRLSILVEGESLFNDAAAIALFGVFVALIAGTQEPDLLSGSFTFLKGFFGGIAVGVFFAALVAYGVRFMRGLPLAEITLTVALAYLSYVVADHYLGVSGVVASVTAGLYIGSRGRVRLSPETWDGLVRVWDQLNFWASTMIFILAAMLVPRLLLDLQFNDAIMLIVLIVMATLSRVVVAYMLLPLLAAFGLSSFIGRAHKLVVVWGGLRGAVTLALALSVIENPAIPHEFERFVAVLATGLVLFTLFVNGPTLRPLLRLLGLDRLSPREAAMRDRVMALSDLTIREHARTVARDNGIDLRLAEKIPGPRDVRSQGEEESPDPIALSSEDRLETGLLTLANREGELYFKHLADRTISARFAQAGLAAASRLTDGVKTGGLDGYRAAAGVEMRPNRRLRLALWSHHSLGWEGPLARMLAERFEIIMTRQVILRELRTFIGRSLRPLLGGETVEVLRGVLNERLDAHKRSLAALELQYPNYAELLKTRYLMRSALRYEEIEYRLKWTESLITQEIYNELLGGLRRRRAELDRRLPLVLGMEVMEMVSRVAVFQSVPKERLQAVARRLRPRVALPGEKIVVAGNRGDSMFFISAGEVEVELRPKPVTLTGGEFFGELAMLTGRRRSADVVAQGLCHLLVLEGRDFRKLAKELPELREQIGQIAEQRLKRPPQD